jgi:hypothetical protein
MSSSQLGRRFLAPDAAPDTGGSPAPRTITESIEVDVPVSTAYNQWTQFEDFPLFMEGVEHVEQKNDTRLHWVAQGRWLDERVGREDPRAASRQADQLDQRRRQEDAWHGHVRADRRVANADQSFDELSG